MPTCTPYYTHQYVSSGVQLILTGMYPLVYNAHVQLIPTSVSSGVKLVLTDVYIISFGVISTCTTYTDPCVFSGAAERGKAA